MMKKICIQAGHVNNAGAGAPEEQANNKRIADRLSAMLRDRGFEVYQTDYWAYNDPVVKSTDWDLFLALHCDMDYPNDGGSGFADYPEPSTDSATTESQRICKIINEVYFPETQINYVSHSNANTRYYYMWKHLTAPTPCVLIEMGQSIDPHDKVLLANTTLIASALTRAICKAFGVAYDIDLPPVETEIDKLRRQVSELADTITTLSESLSNEQKLRADCQKELNSANKRIDELLKQIEMKEQEVEAVREVSNKYQRLYKEALANSVDKLTVKELLTLLIKKIGGFNG
jgi:hypothetical protein